MNLYKDIRRFSWSGVKNTCFLSLIFLLQKSHLLIANSSLIEHQTHLTQTQYIPHTQGFHLMNA